MTVEELRAKYAGAYDSDFEFPQSASESESDDDSDDGKQYFSLIIYFSPTLFPTIEGNLVL